MKPAGLRHRFLLSSGWMIFSAPAGAKREIDRLAVLIHRFTFHTEISIYSQLIDFATTPKGSKEVRNNLEERVSIYGKKRKRNRRRERERWR